jgi:hypothetical protein
VGSVVSVSIPPRGQVAKFLSEFDGLLAPGVRFQGILRVTTSSSAGVAVVGLRARYNERCDLLITTTPPVPEQADSSSVGDMYLPHWVDGGGYTTQFVLLGTGTEAIVGIFRTAAQAGGLLPLVLW